MANHPRQSISVNGHQSWGSKARMRIDSTLIIERLQRHILDDADEMPQSKINAARVLLDRSLPTIAAIQVEQGDGGNAKQITNDQLLNIIEGKAKRIA